MELTDSTVYHTMTDINHLLIESKQNRPGDSHLPVDRHLPIK